jgi:uncharacterized protein
MLIEFRVENHRSLRDEQALTMEAANLGDKDDPRPREVDGHKEKLLPVAVLYGANASGKSNVLAALSFMQFAVSFSPFLWNLKGGIMRSPFAWGDKRNEPSLFEVTFVFSGTKYCYGFSITSERVEEEWFFAWPKKRKQIWFERERQEFKFGDHLKGPNEVIKEVTDSNALFLSTAGHHSHGQLKTPWSWFGGFQINVPPHTKYMKFFKMVKDSLNLQDDSDERWMANRLQLVKAADIGVVDIKTIEKEKSVVNDDSKGPRTFLQHQLNDDDSWLPLEEESEGTKTLFKMAPSVFETIDTGGVLVIDELESSLHPALGLAIIELFNSPKTNPNNAQLIFTTHDTNLLGTTLGEPPLRRDQVWFAEKDKDGASKIYPLTDYKPRNSENLERGYLQGRYGAIPYLGDLARIGE